MRPLKSSDHDHEPSHEEDVQIWRLYAALASAERTLCLQYGETAEPNLGGAARSAAKHV